MDVYNGPSISLTSNLSWIHSCNIRLQPVLRLEDRRVDAFEGVTNVVIYQFHNTVEHFDGAVCEIYLQQKRTFSELYGF